MALKWGIKHRVLFLALCPAIVISLLLGVYFTNIRLEELSKALNDRGTAVITQLASQGEYGVFAGDIDALRSLARRELNNEVTGIAYYSRDGIEIASVGKLMANIQPPTVNLNSVHIVPNPLNDTIAFLTPVTLPEVVIDDFSKSTQVLDDANLKATVIGWLRVELDRKATRLKEYQVLIHSSLLVLFGLCISGLLALRMGYNVTQPIIELTHTVEQIRQGKLNTRIHTEAQWELAILESGINAMASSLEVAHEELQNSVEQATADLRNTLKTIEIQNIELEISRKESENANKVKSEFLASMSHEIRTPLNGIIGFINLLQKTSLSEKQHDFLLTIQKSANSLLSIINDILDFSKIEAGKLHLDLIPMDIQECIEDSLTLLVPSAHEKALEIVPVIYSDVPQRIIGDPLRIKQVLTNLVSNSIKFTEKGSVVIRCMLDEMEGDNAIIRISVTDTGIGLTEEQQKKLFHAFNQTNPNITRKFGGTGLGLVISKKLVEQMNGTIELESTPSMGTTFWFTINVTAISDENHAEDPQLPNTKIILYEKHPVARLSLLHVLQKWGVEVDEIDDSADIKPRIEKAFQEQAPYHMALIGINQPSQPQQEFITHLIQSIRNIYHCPVGILANTTDHIIHNQILQTGASLCLAKPACRKKLHRALHQLLIEQQHTQPIAPFELPKLSILAVDDNQANLKLVSVLLENIGVSVQLANSGAAALEQIQKMPFNLILMDIHMPELDGIQTTQAIRSQKNFNQHTPIVALTAYILDDELEAIQQVGFNDHLSKPIDENSLRAAIYKWTHHGTIEQTGAPSTMTTSLSQNTEESVNNIPTISVPIDWALCKKLAGYKADLAKEMLDMLIQSLPNDKHTIQQAYLTNDLTELKEQTHRLHGACCYVGVPRLKTITWDIERALQQQLPKVQLQPLLGKLDIAIQEVLDFYEHAQKSKTLFSKQEDEALLC